MLILVFAWYLGRAIVLPIRRAAGMAGRIAGGELSARMPETGIGEVGMLEGAFNKMAASLEENQAELRWDKMSRCCKVHSRRPRGAK